MRSLRTPPERTGGTTVRLLSLLLASLAPWCASAEVLLVGPQSPALSLAQAVERAKDGDEIALLEGEYLGRAIEIKGLKLTLRGVGKRPVIKADPKGMGGRALLIVRDADVTVENLEFRGARSEDADGAALRLDGGRLTVRRSAFIDNETGIRTTHAPGAELTVIDSELGEVPRVEGGLHHLLQVGRIARFAISGSRLYGGFEGHMIKSGARENRIAYNLIYDGPDGGASYQIDLPNGGLAWIIGNVIGKGAEAQNMVHLAYGSEGRPWDRNGLYLSHNTFVGQPWPPSWFVRVFEDRLPAGLEVRAVNNLAVGVGVFSPGTNGHFAGNAWTLRRRTLQSVYTLEFGLVADSSLRGAAADPGSGGGQPLAPTAEFTLPVGTRPIQPPKAWSPGAYQPP